MPNDHHRKTESEAIGPRVPGAPARTGTAHDAAAGAPGDGGMAVGDDGLLVALEFAGTVGGFRGLADYVLELHRECVRLTNDNERLRELIHAANRQLQFLVFEREQRERDGLGAVVDAVA